MMNEPQKSGAALVEVKEAEERLSTADLAAASERRTAAKAEHVGLVAGDDSRPAALLAADEAEKLRGRWNSIQTGFVDDPRHSVEEADNLVAALMKQLATIFADERAKLENQWSRGGDVSTEDLRVALRKYRSFFDRLLSI